MIVVSYDIADDKMRTHFSKMLKGNGAIRLQYSVYEVRNTIVNSDDNQRSGLQYSVYEVRNTKRIMDNLVAKIEAYSKHFTADDSVVIFDIDSDKMTKYGRAIHRDQDVVYF